MKKSLNRFLLAMFFLFPATLFASTEQTASPFPDAKEGINIMPMSEIKLPEAMKMQMINKMHSLAANGYDNTTETDRNVFSLLAIQKTAGEEVKQFDNSADPYDTHLKSSLSKLRLSFKFEGVPGLPKERVLGYAAAGGYKNEKGWDGVVEFIVMPKIGVCSFTTYAIEKVILDKESLLYLVNKKPSNKDISGNWNVGFLYTLNWYTPKRYLSFQCASKQFNPDYMNQIVEEAKKVDNSLFSA